MKREGEEEAEAKWKKHVKVGVDLAWARGRWYGVRASVTSPPFGSPVIGHFPIAKVWQLCPSILSITYYVRRRYPVLRTRQ